MRRVALIYNPMSGQHSNGYAAAVESALAVLREAGVDGEMLHTEGPGTAGEIARQAVSSGCDTVLACGGDGTVHEVLQTLVGSQAALGVVPMGTANALAADLGLFAPPERAARTLLTATPVRVSVGRIHFHDRQGLEHSRYFTVAAGVGVDGLFFYRLDTALKRRFGYAAYVMEAFHLWSTHQFPLFDITVRAPGSRQAKAEQVSQLLAVRISNFGGLVQNLVPGAALRNNNLRLVAFKTRSAGGGGWRVAWASAGADGDRSGCADTADSRSGAEWVVLTVPGNRAGREEVRGSAFCKVPRSGRESF